MDYLTTRQAADALGLTVQGVIGAIKAGRLAAEKVGEGRRGQWLILRTEVERYAAERRPAGRPSRE